MGVEPWPPTLRRGSAVGTGFVPALFVRANENSHFVSSGQTAWPTNRLHPHHRYLWQALGTIGMSDGTMSAHARARPCICLRCYYLSPTHRTSGAVRWIGLDRDYSFQHIATSPSATDPRCRLLHRTRDSLQIWPAAAFAPCLAAGPFLLCNGQPPGGARRPCPYAWMYTPWKGRLD